MSKNRSTQHLFQVRIRQLGNPSVKEGFSYDAQGNVVPDVVPDIGNNRRTRRMLKAALRKKNGSADICGQGEA